MLRKTITIANSGSELTNYQIRAEVQYESTMRRDFADIRFYNTDGETALNHWRETYITSQRAVFWVKVPTIVASDDTIIFMEYGDPGLSSASDDVATMIAAADFDDGTTTGWTINTAGSGVCWVPTITGEQLAGYRVDWMNKFRYINPTIPVGGGGAWDDASVRDIGIVIDEDGYLVEEADGLWGYYGGYSGSVWQIGLAKSTDHGLTWTKYGSNPVVTPSGTPGHWYKKDIFQPSVVKQDGGTLIMAATGWQNGWSDSSIGILSSTGGITWSDEGQKLILTQFDDGGDSPVEMGVASLIRRSDDTWTMLFEARTGLISSDWRIYGATASDPVGTWTVMNSGAPVFTPTGSGWEQRGVANPDLIETESGEFLMMYNGIEISSAAWAVGFASTPNLSTWTRYSGNPTIDLGEDTWWDDTHVETSQLVKEDGPFLRIYYQGFLNTTVAQIGMAVARQTRGLVGQSAANEDAWLIGTDLGSPSSGYSFEAVFEDDPDSGPSGTSEVYLALYNDTAVPSPDTAANLNAKELVSIRRGSPWEGGSPPGSDYNIYYVDTVGGFHYWDGSAWQTGTPTTFSGPGIHKLAVWDDGTNYKMDVRDLDGTSLLPNVASIAKSSVRSPSNGVIALAGELFTNAYYNNMWIDNLFVREYVSPEPTITWGLAIDISPFNLDAYKSGVRILTP